MLSLQEISDRLEIQDLCCRYSGLIDTRNFEALRDEVFAEDAELDYTEFGGPVGGAEETVTFLAKALAPENFPSFQHLVANMQIQISGDTATGRIMCFHPITQRTKDGGKKVILIGLWYIDTYTRTPQGWRIQTRSEEKSWIAGADLGLIEAPALS